MLIDAPGPGLSTVPAAEIDQWLFWRKPRDVVRSSRGLVLRTSAAQDVLRRGSLESNRWSILEAFLRGPWRCAPSGSWPWFSACVCCAWTLPTASEGAVASHCFVGFVACEAPDCPRLISSTVATNGELVTKVFIEFHCGFLIGLLIRAAKGYILFRLSCLIRRASETGPRTTPGHMRHTSRRSPV